MESVERGFIRLELKYCERCGGLWLRPRESEVAFCRACAKAMAGLRGQWNGTAGDVDALTGQPAQQRAFWSEGGNA